MLQPKMLPFKDTGQQKVVFKSHNHFTNLQTMCKTNIRIWVVSTITVSESATKSPELFY